MISIPIYHLMVYNGVFYTDNTNAYIGLALSVGGAIPADYAFMAMSAYFLIRKDSGSNIKRFIMLLLQVIVLFLIKYITLRSLFGYNNTEYFVDFFLMKGAWWYIYPYLCLLITYPLINNMIAGISDRLLCVITLVLGIILLFQGIYNHESFIQDLIAFLFTYVLFAYLNRRGFFDKQINKRLLTVIVIVCEIIMIGASLIVKSGALSIASSRVNEIIRFIIGRYHPLSVLVGYLLFLIFLNVDIGYHMWINRLARVTLYVFLLHDTIMGVFWYFGVCDSKYAGYDTISFVMWMIIYVVTCFLVCSLIKILYDKTLYRLFSKAISKIGNDNGKYSR